MAKPASGTSLDTGHALYTSLVAAWGLLEGTGTSSADSTGNGHTLTLSSSGLWGTNGAGENILHITTGAHTPADIATPLLTASGTPWSIAFRAKQAASNNFGMVLGDDDDINNFVWFQGTQITYRPNGAAASYTWTGLTLTTVYNYLLVYDGGTPGNVILYQDGVSLGSKALATGHGAFSLDTIGNAYTSTTFAHVGDIEYVYVWNNRALNSTDAGTLHSNPYVIFSAPTNSPPNTPTISAGTPTTTTVTLTGSAFSDPDGGDTHAASQWQVTTSADTGYASPVISTGDDATNKTSYNATGLTANTAYIARVRYKDSAGNYSSYATNASFTTAAGNTVSVTQPQYKGYQRDGSNSAAIPLSGTYTGTAPTTLKASLAGATAVTLTGTTIGGGAWSGTATITVTPFTSNTQGSLVVTSYDGGGSLLATASAVSDIGIGDCFATGGESNPEGRGTNAQSFSHATLKATVYKENDTWALGNDPTDTGTANGSYWPLLATQIMADQGVPVFFITKAQGSTYLYTTANQWEFGGTLYNGLITQVNEAATLGIKAVLFYIGTNDAAAVGGVDRATFLAKLQAMADGFAANITGSPKTVVYQIGYTAAADPVRLAISDAWDAGGNIVGGPTIYDLSNEVHPASDAKMLAQANRYWAALKAEYYGGTAGTGRGPKALSAAYTSNTITVAFDKTLKTGTTLDSTLWTITDGNSRTVSSAAVSGSNVVLTCSGALAGPVTVSYGLGGSTATKVAPQGPDITLAAGGTINLPAEPFSALTATTGPSLSITRSGAIADGGTDAIGTIAQGSTQSLSYTITNSGDATATLGTITVGAGLTITADPSGLTIAPAATRTLTVSVDTSAVASISAAVSIPSDDSASPYNWTVTASVTDQTAPTVTSARFTTAAANEIRVNLSETCTGTLGFSVSDGGAAITVTPTNNGTYILLALSRAADMQATTLDYDSVSGDVADAASSPNALASFSGTAVSAYSAVSRAKSGLSGLSGILT